MSKLKLSILVMLTLAVLPIASASAIPEIKLFPDTGTATTIQGSGFAPWQNVKIYWNNTQMVTLPYGAMLFAGPSGNFVAMITALNQTANTYTIVAINTHPNATVCNASAIFTVPNFNGLDGKNGINGTSSTEAGPKGDKGDAGSVWFSGNVDPTPATGKDGDFYLHTTTSDVWKRVLGVWGVETNIKGLIGIAGENGLDGVDGVDGVDGTNGIDGINGIDGLDGVDGTNGIDGTDGIDGVDGLDGSGSGLDGTMWFTGTTAPSSTLGADNDLYLRTTTSNVYKKIDGTWEILMNIMGATGASGSDGATGATGSTGATGAVGPLGPRGQVGEIGATGAQGLQGIQGVKGEMGDVGATGATGSIGLTGLAGKDADTNMVYLALIMAFIAVLGVAWVYRKQSEYE